MGILDFLKKRNRTLLEMHLGMLVFGLLCQAVGMWFAKNRWIYTWSLWLGILLAGLAAVHMYRSLDRSLDQGEQAVKLIFRDYLIRYVAFALILLVVILTKVLNPLLVFLGYMGLKVSALVQPFTHKLCNWIFQETDPVPEPIPEDGLKEGIEKIDLSEKADLSEEKIRKKDLPEEKIRKIGKINLSEKTGKEV